VLLELLENLFRECYSYPDVRAYSELAVSSPTSDRNYRQYSLCIPNRKRMARLSWLGWLLAWLNTMTV